MTQSPPGWYHDPAPPEPGAGPLLRFWDGRQWSRQVEPLHGPTGPTPPYAAQQPPGPTTPDGVPLAGFWPRVAAHVLDGALLGAVGSMFMLPLQLGLQKEMQQLLESEPAPRELLSAYLDMVLPILIWSTLIGFVSWAVYTAVMLRLKGATIGKIALGLSVRLRDRPGTLPWSSIAARIVTQHGYLLTVVVPWVYLALSWFPLLDGLWAAGDKKRQALHDKAARTNVVRTR